MKVRYISIVLASVGDFIQTRWGDDLVHLKVQKIITIPSDPYVRKELECEIATIDLDYYKSSEE